MTFTPEELKYLSHVLSCTDNYTVARGEQLITPSVKHKDVMNKIEFKLLQMSYP